MTGMVSLTDKKAQNVFLKRALGKSNGPLSNEGYSEGSCRLDILLLH